MPVEIINGAETGSFTTTSAKTNIPQNQKLETTMKNLCKCLGIKKIFRITSSRMSKFYKPDGPYTYQSASNVILLLSEEIATKFGTNDL